MTELTYEATNLVDALGHALPATADRDRWRTTLGWLSQHSSVLQPNYGRTPVRFDDEYRYLVEWFTLGRWLDINPEIESRTPFRFVVGFNAVTDCYWYEVVWRAQQLADSVVRDTLAALDLLPTTGGAIPRAPVIKEHGRVETQMLRLKQVIGLLAALINDIFPECLWLHDHLADSVVTVRQQYEGLRLLGCWIVGCKQLAAGHHQQAANLFCTAYTCIDGADAAIQEVVHVSAKAATFMALGHIEENEHGDLGYAIACYQRAQYVGWKITDAQKQLNEKNDNAVYKRPVPPLELDIAAVKCVTKADVLCRGTAMHSAVLESLICSTTVS